MFLLSLSDCGDSVMLKTILLIGSLVNIIFIAIPIILILMLMIDLSKAVIANDEAAMKKATSMGVKRILNAVMLFFVPLAVSVAINLLEDVGVDYATCYNVTSEQVSTVLATENAIKAAEKAAKEKAAQEYQEQLQQEKEKRKEALQAMLKKIRENPVSNADLQGSGCDGVVYYENGTFYRPSSYVNGTDKTKGSAKYGYNKYFYVLLSTFTEAAKNSGYSVNMSTTTYGAWRPYNIQQYFYNCYRTKSCNNGNLAAYPGTSNHGWGIASDLSFGSYSAKVWAHNNAKKYGLSFPLCKSLGSNCIEDWHIEPYSISTNSEKVKQCL